MQVCMRSHFSGSCSSTVDVKQQGVTAACSVRCPLLPEGRCQVTPGAELSAQVSPLRVHHPQDLIQLSRPGLSNSALSPGSMSCLSLLERACFVSIKLYADPGGFAAKDPPSLLGWK